MAMDLCINKAVVTCSSRKGDKQANISSPVVSLALVQRVRLRCSVDMLLFYAYWVLKFGPYGRIFLKFFVRAGRGLLEWAQYLEKSREHRYPEWLYGSRNGYATDSHCPLCMTPVVTYYNTIITRRSARAFDLNGEDGGMSFTSIIMGKIMNMNIFTHEYVYMTQFLIG